MALSSLHWVRGMSPRFQPGPVLVAGACAIACLATLMLPPAPLLLWNPSPSSPTGLYVVREFTRVRVGDMAVAWAPAAARHLADERHYLPARVPLVKRVAAARGDLVCARAASLKINGRPAAVRRRRDPRGRLLPWWTGCRRLRGGELLLLSSHAPLAFDGRYFGVTRPSEVIGEGRLLWGS